MERENKSKGEENKRKIDDYVKTKVERKQEYTCGGKGEGEKENGEKTGKRLEGG